MSNTVSNLTNGLQNINGSSANDWLKSESLGSQIIIGLAIVIVIYILVALITYVAQRYLNILFSKPTLIKGKWSASVGKTIQQDPTFKNSTLIRRSVNEKKGIEFTYMTWLKIDGWEDQSKNWKHIFHKGPSISDVRLDPEIAPHEIVEIQAPGAWLHPNKNTIRVYMNTYDNANTFVDIENVPISKWVHMAIVLTQRHLDIYINGMLKERKELQGIPRQNYYNVYIAQQSGFNGSLSDFRYFNFALKMYQLSSIISKGPTLIALEKSAEDKINTPYLHERWWLGA
jgi:hypothetical protein